MGEEALERCVTCKSVPLTLYTLSEGVIARVRSGCLCSSVIVYSDREQSALVLTHAECPCQRPHC